MYVFIIMIIREMSIFVMITASDDAGAAAQAPSMQTVQSVENERSDRYERIGTESMIHLMVMVQVNEEPSRFHFPRALRIHDAMAMCNTNFMDSRL